MHFVNNKNTISPMPGGHLGAFQNMLTNVINACMRIGVYLNNVKRSTGLNATAYFTLIARFSNARLAILAVYGFGQQPRGCCFAYAARSNEQIGVSNLTAGNFMFQRGLNMVLISQLGPNARTIFLINCRWHKLTIMIKLHYITMKSEGMSKMKGPGTRGREWGPGQRIALVSRVACCATPRRAVLPLGQT